MVLSIDRPPLEQGKEAQHLLFGLLSGHLRVGLRHVGGAEVDHLLHGHVVGKLAILVAIGAIVGAFAAVLLRAVRYAGSHRHPARLTEFHVAHLHFYIHLHCSFLCDTLILADKP